MSSHVATQKISMFHASIFVISRLGRKYVAIVSASLTFAVGISHSYIRSFPAFLVARFLLPVFMIPGWKAMFTLGVFILVR